MLSSDAKRARSLIAGLAKSATFCLLLLMMLDPLPVVADSVRIVGGDRYIFRAGQWLRLDATNREWTVSPGRIAVRFHASVSDAPDSLWAGTVRVALQRPRASVTGYYRYAYDSTADALDVLETILDDPRVEDAYVDTRIDFLGAEGVLGPGAAVRITFFYQNRSGGRVPAP